MLNQQKVMYILEMHKQGEMVRRVIHAQSTKGHIHTGNARADGQTDHSCSINKRSHTSWKCTNEGRWSDRSFMLNGHIQAGNAQTRQDGQTDHPCSINQKVTYSLKMHKQGKMVRHVMDAQKVTYMLEMHKQGKMVRQIMDAQSTKGHIHPGNAQMRQDGQTGHSCSMKKKVTYRLDC